MNRMTKHYLLAGLIVACGLTLQATAQVTEELHQTYPLAATGHVSVHNVNGSVRITGWDRAEVKLDAVKRGRDQQALQEASIVIDARADSIDIRTRYPQDGSHHNAAGVEYTLSVPRGAELSRISTVNGQITIEGVAGTVRANSVNGAITATRLEGDADFSTVNGRVELDFEKFQARSLKASSVNGGLSVALPAGAGAQLSAQTVNGRISSDFDVSVRQTRSHPNSVTATVGPGGAPVKLNTVNGAIALRRR
jgi:DUF4097 and DUF4098 domain-containing protein YvlB